jgi:hypothetical protein
MAYKIVRQETFSSWYSYSGAYEQTVINLKGPPEQVLPTSVASSIANAVLDVFGRFNETVLAYVVEADTSPTLYTRYRVTVCSHDSVTSTLIKALMVSGPFGLALASYFIYQKAKSPGTVEEPPAAPEEGLWGLSTQSWIVIGAAALLSIILLTRRK